MNLPDIAKCPVCGRASVSVIGDKPCATCRMVAAARRRELKAEQKRLADRLAASLTALPFGKDLVGAFPYESLDGSGTRFECRLYMDGSTSCSCPNWSRPDADGTQSCLHTDDVYRKKDGIFAVLRDGAALVRAVGTQSAQPSEPVQPVQVPTKSGRRKFDLTLE